MEVNKQFTIAHVSLTLLMLWLVVFPVEGCPPDGRTCRDCILNQMKHDCPPCGPILHCMARCLWDGSSKPRCVKKCDCNGRNGYPTLSDCKRCMSRCKCSCIS
ncbi:TNFR/CD27/30/40/95 cysteine-rich region [Quillaja saponaria]|uniref:TNFR/CD27/30/40/95 cysteine-rich region n=1 Tax=Quillaja saponaria TaxID=32244 RepID=A0AAD7M0P1_QUISA|nr:TNFR/CD27/30/40/95 cysteine-rich region [Quillaja saponaria]